MTLPINPDGSTVYAAQNEIKPTLLNLSIVTRVKNRRHHLIQSLPTWLQLPAAEIIIVDWNSDKSLATLPAAYADDRIKVVRIENKKDFDRSAAWNTGIAHASAEWVMLLDSDVKVISNPFTDRMFSLPSYDNYFRFYSDKYAPFFYGSSIILKEQWEAVGGFLESMSSWGWEDTDFYGRMEAKYNEVTLPLGYFDSIRHSDDERHAEHAEKDLRISAARNAYLAKMVDEISIKCHDEATVFGCGGASKSTHYHQHISYSESCGAIQELIHSDQFATLVKKYNLFDGTESLRKLFDLTEFKNLEKEIYGKHRQPTAANSKPKTRRSNRQRSVRRSNRTKAGLR